MGTFPTILKRAKVIPIYKDGEKHSPSNCRPISEKTLQTDLTKFLNKHQIISKCQFGFQEKLSTTDALTDMCLHIQNQRACKKITSGVFIDLK